MFLTLEDPNAKIKGSRDPLGVQPIWAKFGRYVVTNLTMQTDSTRGFTILLLGRYLTERLIEEGRLGRESALDAFLRFEQIGAYVREAAHHAGGDIRGIERVRSRLAEHRGRVPISASPDGLILGDQKVNGLWGLFSVSARASRLILDGPVGLTPEAREFIECAYLPLLRPGMKPLLRLVAQDGQLDIRAGAPDTPFSALSKVLSESFTEEERRFYGEYLRDGRHVKEAPPGREAPPDLQRRFRELLVAHTDLDTALGREDIVRLHEVAAAGTGEIDDELAKRLDRIARVEAVLAPLMSLFDFMLTGHQREIGDMGKELTERWGTSVPNVNAEENRDLLSEIGSMSSETVRGCFDRCQQGLSAGNYQDVLDALLEWHGSVMKARGGASWVLGEGGRLDVRYRGADRSLPSGDDLPTLWRNGYFIPPLKTIVRQLEKAA